jgi:Ca2+-transporting ATPase
MMIGTIAVLDAYYPGGVFTLFAGGAEPNHADEVHARTMAFTTLMMFQLYNAYVSRSSTRSAFAGFFDNRWLLAAVVCSLIAQVLVVHVPALQAAFRTAPLSPGDWLISASVGAVLLLVMEVVKAATSRGQRTPVPATDSLDRRPAAHARGSMEPG